MQRSLPGHGTTSSSSSSAHSALSAVRRTLRPSPSPSLERAGADVDVDDEDQELELADLADPRPWETRAPLKHYGSHHSVHSADHGHLPLYKDSYGNGPGHGPGNGHGDSAGIGMETRQRRAQAQAQYGEKEGDVTVSETDVLDDQGKWQKGHLAGPGVGGRRGLPPKQRIPGWVSNEFTEPPTWGCTPRLEG
jgi:dolichyl-phosphate-mannose-protein mannosyltransferase